MSQERMLTTDGHRALLDEHRQLSRTERPRVVKGIADAAAEGDRSENAEYIYGKKKLREIDKRLAYLARLLKDVKIVNPATLSGVKVKFGATVIVEDEDGEEKTYTIVGEGEADLKNRTISYRAPVARALLGKEVGDIVTVERPKGEIELEVKDLLFGARRWTETT